MAEVITDIFTARGEANEASRRYNEQLEEFAHDLAALQKSGQTVRVKGYPRNATCKVVNPDTQEPTYFTVACAPLIPIKDEPEQPWERQGKILGCQKLFGNVEFDLGQEVGGSYITFSVSRLVSLEVVDASD